LKFLDTNIVVYSLLPKQAPQKHDIAVKLLREPDLILSSQVINELATAVRSKGGIGDVELRRIVDDLYLRYDVIDLISEDIFAAFALRERFNFSYWDSLIVATALRAGSEILFSEDMQDGLVVDGKMTIRNPFLHAS
jgi:predicted nucleic acid-binding protein